MSNFKTEVQAGTAPKAKLAIAIKEALALPEERTAPRDKLDEACAALSDLVGFFNPAAHMRVALQHYGKAQQQFQHNNSEEGLSGLRLAEPALSKLALRSPAIPRNILLEERILFQMDKAIVHIRNCFLECIRSTLPGKNASLHEAGLSLDLALVNIFASHRMLQFSRAKSAA